ncbi:DEAD/DEAH box helicase [Falsirhodobacter sp. 20TX0035]|uniref:DEAD/DEAH box helicase n=1 Tax=Falsirhodobacter sp. 20TX0035 TaxID=3022019 RepID=UPI00233003B6|nr:DEAD/DEAH box helicase [Falsirhodobacter sp. 20TX0035]MDB6454916.1 helicase-related protein [Falsirhodobacter sp. 20TX0035]
MTDPHPVAAEAVALLRALAPGGRVLHVARDERAAEALAAFLRGALPDRRVLMFPGWDCLPFDGASPTPDAMGRRMAVLTHLAEPEAGDVVVVPLPVLLQRLPPPSALRHFPIRTGQPLDVAALEAFARDTGYEVDERVDEPGEIALRGGTIEVFGGGESRPCRIEMADGQVTALRAYDPVTQRSTTEMEALDLVPVTELPPAGEDGHARGAEHRLPDAWDALATLPDHMGEARITALPATLADAARRHARLAEARDEAEADAAHPLPVDALYVGPEEWEQLAERIETLPEPESRGVPGFAAAARPRARLAQFLNSDGVAGRRVVFVAGSPTERARLVRMVGQADGHPPEAVDGWAACEAHDRAILLADLEEGVVTEDVVLVTAQDLMGSRAGAARDRLVPAMDALPFTGFDLGDLVVHEDHGLARLEGLETLDPDRPGSEAIRLTFAQDERLMVPTHDAGRIWRYGTAEAGVKLDRVRGTAWPRRRKATEAALAKLADHLVDLTRKRDAATAPKLVPPARDYERFVARFPFPLTPDQAEATRAVLKDMASGRPMDRLVIGDVGFGKTEVALRAAAAAALAGRQVAVCAPTTVLARQHYETFRRRFAPLGIEVGHLSRLVTGKPATAVRAALADGSIRIAVGTHALIGKNVHLPDLGLLIIDEEQRFGSAQKEKMRALGKDGHVLSMSATPIPRTLQTALVGLQDLSFMATPPARRRPIRTLIAEDSDVTLRQALLRERRRGGRSFVVVPRIEDIGPIAERLERLLPQLRLRVAHGDLSAAEIDATMVGFAAGEGDVLLATGIIESGLDVARANTMLILRPALFGLAQLHQLRGRVGRGAAQAYCHLLTAEGEELAPDAQKRLGTLQAMDRLGAGMAISAADLDRRGAGDLLGDQQAGHVQRVGLGLYQEMLAIALRRAKGEPEAPPSPKIPGEPGHIPADYIPEPENRIDLYHRIARAQRAEEVNRLSDEIADRFGPPPESVDRLLRAALLRALAGGLGVDTLNLGPEGVALDFRDDVDLAEYEGLAIDGLSCEERRLTLHRPGPEDRLKVAGDLLEQLA